METSSHPVLLDQLDIREEPRALLGRYFLAFETEAAARGIEFRLASAKDLVDLYETTAASWNGFTPVFDHRTTDIPSDETAIIIGYARDGQPVVAHACRLFDFGDKTVKDAIEDLSFWYGNRAFEHRHNTSCSITAPTAAAMTGRMLYIGAFWVHPAYRKISVGHTVQELARCYGLSQWGFDNIVTVGSEAFRRPELQQRYGFDGYEDQFTITQDGRVRFHGLFVWTSRRTQIARLNALIGGFEREAELLHRDRREQKLLP